MEPPRQDPRTRPRALALAGFLTVLALSLVAALLMARPAEDISGRVLVPEVIGMGIKAAKSSISAAGLEVRNVVRRPTDIANPGNVLEQNPMPGSPVAPGAVVDLVVAAPPPPVMPDVSQLSREAAAVLLAESSIVDVEFVFTESTEAFGTVLAQSPAPGSFVDEGVTVSLALSDGSVLVPDLVGMWKDSALQAAQAASLEVELQKVRDNSSVGRIVGQAPLPGTVVRPGATVVLTVARAKSS